MDKLQIGQRGWIVYGAKMIHVEFVGYGHYEPDYPSERTRYYRALERVDLKWTDVDEGNIVDFGGQHTEQIYPSSDAAKEAARAEERQIIAIKERELAEAKERLGRI